ncbi:MAG TPA: lysine exporter LysO family protein [Euryarchaeota archaeon]|nr:lysine exporter LysO family protein [Euryarchaeota archaeon]
MKYWEVLIALIIGIIIGILGVDLSNFSFSGFSMIDILLVCLLLLIGVDFALSDVNFRSLSKNSVKFITILVISTYLGAALAGYIAVYFFNDYYALIATLGCGWYSYTSATLVRYSVYWGSVALIANILREIACIMLYPALNKKLKISAITIGGATTMDTSFPVISSFGGKDVALIAFAHGLIITLTLPIIIETLLSFI